MLEKNIQISLSIHTLWRDLTMQNEFYYNMALYLNDAEVHKIWGIVGEALDRNGFPDHHMGELSIRVYDESLTEQPDETKLDKSLEDN